MPGYGPVLATAIDDYLGGVTVKAMLVDDTYVPGPDETAAPTGSEISGGGYPAGGIDVTSQISAAYDATNDRVEVSVSGDVDFGTITATGVGGIVFYVVSGAPLVADMFGSTDSDGSESFVYTPAAEGVLWVVFA